MTSRTWSSRPGGGAVWAEARSGSPSVARSTATEIDRNRHLRRSTIASLRLESPEDSTIGVASQRTQRGPGYGSFMGVRILAAASLLLFVVSAIACGGGGGPAAPIENPAVTGPGDYELQVASSGGTRRYSLHVPAGWNG